MPTTVRCPHCRATLAVPDSARGLLIRCDTCGGEVATRDSLPLARRPTRHPAVDPGPGLPVARRAEPRRPARRPVPARGNGVQIALLVGIVVVVVLVTVAAVGYGVWWLTRPAPQYPPPPATPTPPAVQVTWHPHVQPDRFTAMFPGRPLALPSGPDGGTYTARTDTPAPGTIYWAHHGANGFDARPLDWTLAQTRRFALGQFSGVMEVQRRPVQLGAHAGEEVIAATPDGAVKAIVRTYLAHGRVYAVAAGGRGFDPTHADARKFLDSFAITEQPPTPRPAPPLVAAAPAPFIPPVAAAPIPATPPTPPTPPAYEFPPLPDAVPITPAVTAATTVPLPEPAGAVRVGGGGRFLVLHLPKLRKLAVFDTAEGRIARHIPVAEDEVGFAACMTKLVVFLPRAKVFQRYDLLTGVRELVAPAEGRIQPRPEWDTGGRSQPQPTVLPVGRVTAFCMGHASAGPFLMGIENGPPGVYDLATLRPVLLPGNRALSGGWYWAGATGRLLGNSGTDGGMPNGAAAVSLKPGGVEVHSQHVPSSYVVPGPDDALVFAGSYGIVTPKTEPAAGVAERAVYKHVPGKALYLPACHGPYYLAVDRPDLAADPAKPPAPTPKPLGTTVQVYLVGDAQPIATLADVPVGRTAGAGAFGPRFGVKLEDHVHLIPRAKFLVALTDGRDALRLVPFDPADALDKTGRPYLVFTSVPPTTFTPGRPFAYQAEVLAKSRPVVFKLQGGPPGMGVSSDGRVTWTPPARVADKGYSPILFATDAAGQEAFQLIELTNGANGGQ